MKTTKQLWAVSAILLQALWMVGCMETGKANELIDKGNKSVEEANKQSEEVVKKINDLFTQENVRDFPENRATLKGKVDDIVSILDKSITNMKNAADNFESVTKLKIDDKAKDYFTTKAQSYRKIAEINAYQKKQVQLLNDESITDHEALVGKITSIDEDIKKLQEEQKNLEDKAQKIQTDNPGLIKKS